MASDGGGPVRPPVRKHQGNGQPAGSRLRMPIATALMLGFGLLVFVGVGSVLGIGMWSAGRNTLDLLADRADHSIDTLTQRLRAHLRPVEEANVFLARMIANGDVDPNDRVQLADYMMGAMAGTPQVRGMTFITPDYQAVRVSRSDGRDGLRVSDWSGNPTVQQVMQEAATKDRPYWGNLVWSPAAKITLFNRRAPVAQQGRFIGQLISVLTIAEISRFIAEAAQDDPAAHPFIL
jgi:adenylate cyclase